MANGEAKIQPTQPVADDLEPYRRLIEIQKELVQLSKQHEASRRECDALRERVIREVIDPARRRNGVHQRLRRSVSKLLGQLSRLRAGDGTARRPNRKPSLYAESH
jgi:hypothetical protein